MGNEKKRKKKKSKLRRVSGRACLNEICFVRPRIFCHPMHSRIRMHFKINRVLFNDLRIVFNMSEFLNGPGNFNTPCRLINAASFGLILLVKLKVKRLMQF